MALKAQSAWISWLLAYNADSRHKDRVNKRQVDASIRDMLDIREANLRTWRMGQAPDAVVVPNVRSALSIVSSAAMHGASVNLVRFSDELAMCIDYASGETGSPVSNTLIRGLIGMVRNAQLIRRGGAERTWVAFHSALASVSSKNEDRRSLPQWVLFEIHKLLDFSFGRSGVPDEILDILCTLRRDEFSTLVRGPGQPKKHKSCQRHLKWQLALGKRAEFIQSYSDQFAISYRMAVTSATMANDIETALECTKALMTAYVAGNYALSSYVTGAFAVLSQYINTHTRSITSLPEGQVSIQVHRP